MSRLVKFIILAVIGFGLGAGLAWIQSGNRSSNVPEVVALPDAETLAPADDMTLEGGVVPEAPDMPAVDGMDNEGAAAAGTPAEAAIAAGTPAVDAPAADAAVTEEAPAEQGAHDAHAGHHDHAAAPANDQPVAGSTVGGAFSLTDHNGQAVTEKSWPGKKKLVFFGFTHCPDICPVALDKMTAALTALGDVSAQVQPLLVTTDPARDTPEVLKEYVSKYHASIVGLTGTEEQVKAARDAYKVYAAKVPGADDAHYLMDHTGYIYLMSEDDQMLEIFGSSDTAETIVEKSRKHLGQ